MAGVSHWARGCALLALAASAASAQDSGGPDPESFRNPPAEARPYTLYFWMNGNVTREGIDADLAAMRDAGLGGVLMFDGSDDVPKGPVDYLSPQWLGLLRHMMDRGAQLGLKVGIHNAPGWSSSGGPWIKPEQAMQQLVWTETTVPGGTPVSLQLARPYAKLGWYRDAATIAFPASAGDDSAYRDAVAAMSAGTVAALTDRDLDTATDLAPGTPLVVTMRVPFTAQAVTLYAGPRSAGFSATIEASGDGQTWKPVGKLSAGTERGIEAPGTLNFAPVTARHFRITPSTRVKLAEALFHATPRIDDWDLKAGHDFSGANLSKPVADARKQFAIDPAAVIDISDKLDAQGRLNWTPPEGRWTVMRIGHTTTGHLNVAASDSGRGLEVDKLSVAAVDHQFDSSLARVIAAAGPTRGTSFDMVEIDSFEAGLQNWTAALPADFARRNGYAITPWLPALTGRIVGDLDRSNRFLFDFRRTLADLMADNYYGRIQTRLDAEGLRMHVEGYGPGAFDALQISGRAEVPMTEFWSRTPWTDNRTVKMVASAAHVYGKNVIAAEAFTGEAQTSRWQDYPYALKTLGDQMFAQGVNQFFFHRYAHQPNPNAVPGMSMGPWGMNFERSNTWFAQARPWMEYLARSQYMLRQGKYAADVLYFVGEDSPNQAEYVRPQVSPDTYPKIGQVFDPQVPAGYQYDLVNAEVLLTRAHVRDGKIVLANGAQYRLLVFPANLDGMTPKLAAAVRGLVEAGAAILGPKPVHPMTLTGDADTALRTAADALWGDGRPGVRRVGRGRVFNTASVGDALAALGVGPDAQCSTASPDGQIAWLHRDLGARHVYYVANRQRRPEQVTCTFRVGHAAPALWNPETGGVTLLALYRSDATTTKVVMDLSPAESTFVMLDKADDAKPVEWLARDGVRIADVGATPAAPAPPPSNSFTITMWAKPDIDLRAMPGEAADGRIDETGKNYLVTARSGADMHGPGTAVAGLALGRNGGFVIERAGPNSVAAVLVSRAPVSGWTHVALVYDRGTPSLYLDGKLAKTGLKSGRTVFAGGGDAPSPLGVTYFFEGLATPMRTVARALRPAEIAALWAGGMPDPVATTPAELIRTPAGLRALAWQSGTYTTSTGASFKAKVPSPIAITGPWTVQFQPGRRAPAQIILPRLASLSRHPDEGVRHFSGTATYARTINVPRSALARGRRVYLDLGRVEVLSGVAVNGKDLGVVWKEPYRVDITGVVKPGANRVSLAVATLWANRMIADAALPEEGNFVDGAWPIGERFSGDGKTGNPIMARRITGLPDWYLAGRPKPEGGRVTFTPWTFYSADEPLLDSGLLGPVRILFADEVTIR